LFFSKDELKITGTQNRR